MSGSHATIHPRATIHIDRVVLRGVDPQQAKAIVEGLRTELATVFSSAAFRARFRSGQSVGVIRLGSVPLGAGRAGAKRFGVAVARAAGKGMRA
jgi:hypothetical protein